MSKTARVHPIQGKPFDIEIPEGIQEFELRWRDGSLSGAPLCIRKFQRFSAPADIFANYISFQGFFRNTFFETTDSKGSAEQPQ